MVILTEVPPPKPPPPPEHGFWFAAAMTGGMGYKPPRSGGLSILQFFLKTTNKLPDQVCLGSVVLFAILLNYLFFGLR
jgi:hypothetical protein